jgi:membrane protease YdiL (CAAX protease family)
MTPSPGIASSQINAWWKYLLCVILACILAGLFMLVLGVVISMLWPLPRDFAAQIQQPKNAPLFFLGIAITFGSLAGGVVFAARIIHKKVLRDLVGQWRWDFFALGAVIWLLALGALSLIDFLIAPQGFSVSVGHETGVVAAVAFGGILVQTFAEELIFRGYITQGLLQSLKRPLPTAVASGLLFGSLHYANGSVQAINATVFGFALALIAIRTGSIAFGWGLHLVNNYFGAVIVVSGNDVFRGSPGLFVQNTPQLTWWDLATATAALILVLWLVYRLSYFLAPPAAYARDLPIVDNASSGSGQILY